MPMPPPSPLSTQPPDTWSERILAIAAVGILTFRPALDVFSESLDPNPSLLLRPDSLLGSLVLLAAGLMVVVRRSRHQVIWTDRGLRNAHLWLMLANGVGLVAGITAFGSQGLMVGSREAARVASTVAALLLVLWWLEGHPERHRTGWMLLLLGTIVPLTAAVAQWITGIGFLESEGLNRLQGTFSHPGSLGLYLVPFIVVAIAGLGSASGIRRWSRLALVGVLGLFLLLTYSRTALIVLVTALALLLLLQASQLGARALGRILLLGVLLFAIAWFLAGDMIRQRFSNITIDREVIAAALEGKSENSLTWRVFNWGTLIKMGAKKPIIGHGLGMTMVLNPIVNEVYGGKPFNAHNDFVRFFFESGAIGLACYLTFGWTLCTWAFRRARTAEGQAAPVSFAMVAVLVSMIFLSLGTTEISSQTAILYQLYGMLALLTVVPTESGAR